jgi:Zn-dependent protease with chaperone function
MELEQQHKFDLLVRQLERSRNRQHPRSYRWRVGAIAAIGYGYIATICAMLLSSLWLVKWLVESTQQAPIKSTVANATVASEKLWILFFVIGLASIVISWFQVPQLTDREIDRSEFPELFALIDELSDRLNAPKIHHAIVNYDRNAAVAQVPHFGWQERSRNYLILGLPLLQSLTPEQFKATLAHELGHLANNDSSFNGYILRIRTMCEQLATERYLFIFNWFFRWYEPLIKAYSFVSVRDREYAADALAQQITSPEIAASDLIQSYIYHHFLQECFSPQLDRQARQSPTPPTDVVTQMLTVLRQPLDPQSAQVWLNLLLGQATDTDDTHPCLSDRLAAVGYPTPKSWTPQPMLQTAAEYFFGDRLADLAAELDLHWYEHHKTQWLHQYQQAQYQQAYLATLDLQSQTVPLSLGDATIRADLTATIHGELVALPLWQQILDRHPLHAQANYQVGKAIIDRGIASGCAYLERAISADPDLVIPSCEELYRFHTFHGDAVAAEIYLEWRQQYLPKQWRSKLERNLKNTDRFIPHDLDADLVDEIRQKLAKYSLINRAYLVCKPMQIFKDRPLYVLALKIANHRSRMSIDVETERDLVDRLQIELNFGNRLLIAIFDGEKSRSTDRQDAKLIANIQKVTQARIF